MGEFTKYGLSPDKIYEYFANGPGTGKLDTAQHATRQEWELEDERADLIRKQGELIRGGWQGAASEGAFGAAQPLAESAMRGAELLSQAEDLLDRQSGSFHRAANSVKPVPSKPPTMDTSNPMLPFMDFETEVTTYQSDAQHNIDVYRVYDGASEYNEKNMPPEYDTVNHAGGSISVTPGDGQPGDTGDFIEVPDGQQPRGGDEAGPYGGRRDPGSGPTDGPVPRFGGPPVSEPFPSGQQQPQQTSPSDFGPRPGGMTSPLPGGQPLPAGPTSGSPTPGPGGFVPVGFPTGGPGSTGGPGRIGSPGSTGGPGARGGFTGGPNATGEPGTAGRGPGGSRGGTLGANPGVGALAAEEAAAQRAATAAAARGSGGSGMMGAPTNAKATDKDDEHQRKVLIEADVDSVFGSDALTAPQVIGDDEYEDD